MVWRARSNYCAGMILRYCTEDGQMKELGAAVLDHGFVEVLAALGSDSTIANVARVSRSAGAAMPYAGDPATEADKRLIGRLMRDQHTSPFEFCELVVRVRAPIFVWRQWHRHRTFSYCEESDRYRERGTEAAPLETYQPGKSIGFRTQGGADNKQGSGAALSEERAASAAREVSHAFGQTELSYRNLIKDGVAREQARIVLTQAEYKTCIVKGNLHNWLRFLKLRCDAHAQAEIREYANAISEMVRSIWPVTFAAWVEYVRDAVVLTATEAEAIRALSSDHKEAQGSTALDRLPWSAIEAREGQLQRFAKKLGEDG